MKKLLTLILLVLFAASAYSQGTLTAKAIKTDTLWLNRAQSANDRAFITASGDTLVLVDRATNVRLRISDLQQVITKESIVDSLNKFNDFAQTVNLVGGFSFQGAVDMAQLLVNYFSGDSLRVYNVINMTPTVASLYTLPVIRFGSYPSESWSYLGRSSSGPGRGMKLSPWLELPSMTDSTYNPNTLPHGTLINLNTGLYYINYDGDLVNLTQPLQPTSIYGLDTLTMDGGIVANRVILKGPTDINRAWVQQTGEGEESSIITFSGDATDKQWNFVGAIYQNGVQVGTGGGITFYLKTGGGLAWYGTNSDSLGLDDSSLVVLDDTLRHGRHMRAVGDSGITNAALLDSSAFNGKTTTWALGNFANLGWDLNEQVLAHVFIDDSTTLKRFVDNTDYYIMAYLPDSVYATKVVFTQLSISYDLEVDVAFATTSGGTNFEPLIPTAPVMNSTSTPRVEACALFSRSPTLVLVDFNDAAVGDMAYPRGIEITVLGYRK